MKRNVPLVLPNFMCIGAQKTGTTALYHILKTHPEITVSKPRKETKFFYRDEEYALGLEYYSNFFSYDTPKKAVGEFDPDYLYFPYVPERIFNDFGASIKFIVILRNPVDRAYSHYLMSVRKGFETLNFNEAIKQEQTRLKSSNREEINNFSYMSRGRYEEQLKRYFKFFPIENFLFINYDEEFNKDLEGALKKIFLFLNIAEVKLNTNIKENIASEVKSERIRDLVSRKNIFKQLASNVISNKEIRKSIKKKILSWNSTKSPLSPLDIKLKKELNEKYFAKSNDALSTLIKKDFSDWNNY